MKLQFTKMHGLGNDYVYVDLFRQSLNGVDLPALARAMSDRHRGIGSDGLILIRPPASGVAADVRMEMFNSDGSRGEMCGNGIRCVGLYAVRRGLAGSERVRVQTDGGISELTVECGGERVARVSAKVGRPVLVPRDIPVQHDGQRCIRAPITINGRAWSMTCVSMGNPHAVFFVDDPTAIDLASFGPAIECHSRFPNRVNAHIAQTQNRGEVRMRTWERGAGITQACGSGACAVLVAGVLEDRLDRSALVHLPGGDLNIDWPADDAEVQMTGPAEEVFSGEWTA